MRRIAILPEQRAPVVAGFRQGFNRKKGIFDGSGLLMPVLTRERVLWLAAPWLGATVVLASMVLALLVAPGGSILPDRETTARASLKKMIGQMLVIGFPGRSMAEEWPLRVAGMIGKGNIGGVLLLGDNIESPAQLRELTWALRRAGGRLPPLIAVDQEGGAVQRLSPYKGFLGMPAAKTVAGTDVETAYALYAQQARQLAAEGITVNLGPVADLDLNPDNPIIGGLERSYGDRPEVVVSFGRAFVAAHRAAGVLTAVKHFPGHGSGDSDPHHRMVNMASGWQKQELLPFRSLMSKEPRVPMVMVGHLVIEGFSDGDAPASLSRRAVTDVLRGELAFDGLIVTDDLDMAAVGDRYGTVRAFVMAAAAGNDLLLFANKTAPDSELVEKVTGALVAAVEEGRISRAQIEASYRRIAAAKQALPYSSELK
ncbi:MAG: glycoside hydrolase family 3 protein [Aestuariivirgaceae bacterium]